MIFGKIKGSGRGGGASSWPHFVCELILEQIANGTPPTSVNANIVSTVRHFSPLTIIKEQPSIWTKRRGRTVLLVVVGVPASKSEAVGSDAYRQQWKAKVAMQDLALSIENDVDGIFE